jgi:hypothetical protein
VNKRVILNWVVFYMCAEEHWLWMQLVPFDGAMKFSVT